MFPFDDVDGSDLSGSNFSGFSFAYVTSTYPELDKSQVFDVCLLRAPHVDRSQRIP